MIVDGATPSILAGTNMSRECHSQPNVPPGCGNHRRSDEHCGSVRKRVLSLPVGSLALIEHNGYRKRMSARVRRITALFVGLALTMALGSQGLRAAQMGHPTDHMMSAVQGTDLLMPTSSSNDDCRQKSKGTSLDCSAVGCGLIALPVMVSLLPPPPRTSPKPYLGTTVAGRSVPPDHYPPRTTIIG